jgi:DNA processing protein
LTRRLSDTQRRDWLRLARSENVGPVTFRELIGRFGEPALALAALPDLARRGGRAAPLHIATAAEAEAELEAGAALGAQLICACEAEFPPQLATLEPPPPVLWVRGNIRLIHRPSVAVVGARVASAAGQRFARGLATELGALGHVIVSGLARGIDAAAHEGALPTGTVAVLGGGIDDIYPPENRGLYERMVEQGCVVSESAPGRRAVAKDFPRRNRIISGLAGAVVVVEAELRSGSLITARLAAEQGREVLAVPGSPLDPRARGTNDLIRQGAAICEGADDVVRALETLRHLREPEPAPFTGQPAEPCDGLRERVADLLSPTPVSRDELARAAGGPPAAVFAALTELALAGRAELLPGGMAASG